MSTKKKLRILIIEDMPDDAELMILHLEEAGFNSDWQRVETEEEYLLALKVPPDLILADWSLPQFSGLRALQLMGESHLDIPFIIVSGNIGEEAAINALRQGAYDYVLKGNLKRLSQSIINALEAKETREAKKRAEEKLRKSEARFRRLAENAQDIIYRVQIFPELKFEYVSPSSTRMIGYTPQEHYNNPMLIVDIIRSKDKVILERLLKGKINVLVPLLLRFKHKKGHYIWVEQRNVPVYDGNGKLVALEGISRDITNRIKIEESLKASRERIQSLSVKVLHAFEEERARLARELHDEVGHSLAAVSMDLQYLELTLSSLDSAQKERLSGSINHLEKTMQNIRLQINALRPPSLDALGLVEVIRNMLEDMAQRAGLQVELRERGLTFRLPSNIEVALYRCIQEALTNVLRHASAGRVTVEFCLSNERITVEIKDDGVGFKTPIKGSMKGVGLIGMQERTDLLEGDLKVSSAPGKGTEIYIDIPLRKD